MVTCTAYGCTNRSDKKKPGVSFHRFPVNHMRLQWVKAISRKKPDGKNWHPSKGDRICSEHFVESDYDKTLSRVRLKDHAVPSVFKGFPKYKQKKQNASCRKASKYFTERSLSSENTCSDSLQESSDFHNQTDSIDEVAAPSLLEVPPSTLNMSFSSYSSCLEESFISHQIPFSPPSPSKKHLKWKLKEMEKKCKRLERKLKTERQKSRRQKKKITDMSTIMSALQKEQFMSQDDFLTLSRASAPFEQILSRLLEKRRKNSRRKFPRKLRIFALNLHYYSPRAYNYVRREFVSCLPHPKTIAKWYSSTKCQPGFTKEALRSLELNCEKLKSKGMPKPICGLIFDEVAIRKHPCFDGKTCHGYVNFGGQNDENQLAKEALVFMVVCLNYDWKIPVGYFLIDSMTSIQKANLVEQCLILLDKTGIKVISLTFDGLPANISMAINLGCDFSDPKNMVTTFPHPTTEEKIAVFLDPCHMLKLIRNCLGEKKVIYDKENRKIEWKYIVNLHNEQNKQGLHLANKVKSNHILFYKQKMKVSLATQVLSDSVADAIDICNKKLKLKEFQECQATVDFIKFFNKLFDLFNSRSMKQLAHKQPVNKDNLNETVAFLKEANLYIDNLKIMNNNQQLEPILSSYRKTGFLGFKICISSLLHLIETLLQQDEMDFISMYRISQDHLELFFSRIRSMGGANNNPTARQFKAAYRKLLIHSELQECTTGNCIPLEEIPILSCSSVQRPDEITDQEPVNDVITEFPDHDYVTPSIQLTAFLKECIDFISGSIVRRISKTLHCEVCINALHGEPDPTSLTSLKSKGRLFHPSIDVIKICNCCEYIFRLNIPNSNSNSKLNVLQFTDATLKSLIDSDVFQDLETHISELSSLNNHRMQLIKDIAHCFYQARIGHFAKKQIDVPSIRNLCTRIPLFKGQ